MRVLPLSSCYGLCLKPFKGMMPYYVRVMDKKYCSGCQRNRRVKFFTEPYTNCDKCREKGRNKWHRQTVERRDEVNERRREYRKSEEVKAREKAYKQQTYRCDVCNCEVRTCNKARHEKTDKHKDKLETKEPNTQ